MAAEPDRPAIKRFRQPRVDRNEGCDSPSEHLGCRRELNRVSHVRNDRNADSCCREDGRWLMGEGVVDVNEVRRLALHEADKFPNQGACPDDIHHIANQLIFREETERRPRYRTASFCGWSLQQNRSLGELFQQALAGRRIIEEHTMVKSATIGVAQVKFKLLDRTSVFATT